MSSSAQIEAFNTEKVKNYPILIIDPRPFHSRLWQALICIPRYVVTGKFHIGYWVK